MVRSDSLHSTARVGTLGQSYPVTGETWDAIIRRSRRAEPEALLCVRTCATVDIAMSSGSMHGRVDRGESLQLSPYLFLAPPYTISRSPALFPSGPLAPHVPSGPALHPVRLK